MQKWEYIEVIVTFYAGGTIDSVYCNNKVVLNTEYGGHGTTATMSDLYDYLNKLGSEGWEMVTAQTLGNKSFTFKRLIVSAD